LTISEPSEQDDVARWEKVTVGFSVTSDIYETYFRKCKVNQPHYRPEVRRVFQEVKVPRLRDNGPGWW
jgi:hypothetical protein